MAKAIRWQVPFCSNDPTNPTYYRIDIYADDDGTWSGITQLTAGDTPFTTDEDNSEDFFAPIRTQTGTLQICTYLDDGSRISLDDIRPADNISRPLQLLNITDPSNPVIEWQGFLSCEAYSQAYTEIPENLSLPVISVLEAMDSVEVDCTRINNIKLIRIDMDYALTELDRKVGMPNPFFSTYYYSRSSSAILQKYIDGTIFYDIKEYTNMESFYYVVSGLSCKKVLERICQYMGWCVREEGKSIYFLRIGEELNMYRQLPADFRGNRQTFETNRTEVAITSDDMEDLEWMGTNHQRSVSQGAKSVQVVAKLEQYELKVELPDFPLNNMLYGDTIIQSYAQMDNAFNNMLTFNYYELTVRETAGGFDIFVSGTADVNDAYGDCVLNPNCDVAANYKRYVSGGGFISVRSIGAFFAKIKGATQEDDAWQNGLYVVASNEIQATDHAPAVFKMDSIINYRLVDGTLVFKITSMTVAQDGSQIADFAGIAYLKLQFGNMYWNGSGWQIYETYFAADFNNSPAESEIGQYVLEIPITSAQPLYGNIVLEVVGSIKGGTNVPSQGYYMPDYDMFITELSVEYEPPTYVTENERSENTYSRFLDTQYRDEISVSAELASYMNNRPSPSLVMKDTNTPMTTMAYIINAQGDTEQRRPEVDLLDRLAAYYGAKRQRLDLIVKHPTAAPLPLLKFNGINDGKKYLPLSESRDWKTEECTLTCFETPE